MTTILLLVAAFTPLAGPVVAMFDRRASVPRAGVVSMGAAAGASLLLLATTAVADDGVPSGLIELPAWIFLGVDRASAVLLAAVTGIGLVVASFSSRSLDAEHHRTRGYFVALGAVATGSALIVLPGGPVPLVAGWLLSGRALVALTHGWTGSAGARVAHRRLRTTMRLGDIALVGAVSLAVAAAGPEAVTAGASAADDLSGSSMLGGDADVAVALLLLTAGATRSALVPFHRWLTATLFAPTPVSAIVHAGFVSGAGLLLIRFAQTFAGAAAAVNTAIVLATMTLVIGSAAALTRPDAKGTLAWSTVAQMAFMVLQCAAGAFAAAVFHIVGHGMYKAAQFLGVGDTIAAGLRKRRRPVRTPGLTRPVRLGTTIAIASVAVVTGVLAGPSGLDLDERVLLVVFAWIALATAAHGALGTRSLTQATAIGATAISAMVAAVGYFVSIDLFKRFLEPSFAGIDVAADGPILLAVATAGAIAALALTPGRFGEAGRAQTRWWVDRATAVRTPLDLEQLDARVDRRPIDSTESDSLATTPDRFGGFEGQNPTQTAELRAQVARAAEIIAPSWPLSSFVAVNPLGGLEHRSFDDAAAEARRWTGGRTHRTLTAFRADHAAGLTTNDDLTGVIEAMARVACDQPPVLTAGRTIDALEIVCTDLLYGPEATRAIEPRTALERRFGVGIGEELGIDDLVADWAAAYVAPPVWGLGSRHRSFISVAREQAIRHGRRRLGVAATTWLESLPEDAAGILAASLRACGVRPTDRIDEIRGHLVSVSGWTALARWRTEWAQADESTPPLRPIELAAARAMLEAAVISSAGTTRRRRSGTVTPMVAASSDMIPSNGDPVIDTTVSDELDHRTGAAIDHLGLPDDDATRSAVRGILSLVPESMRASIWLRAQERHFEERLLGALDRGDGNAYPSRPDAQVVFCIDVRSEGLRRQLEAQGCDETLGFAGFFGVPMSVRELGWPGSEPRCPVLVTPSAAAVERPLDDHIGDAARELAGAGLGGAIAAAHAATKHVPGAAFASAEMLGWFTGPGAAWRTLLTPSSRRPQPATTTTMQIGEQVGVEQRILSAESALRTMGLVGEFSDLVVLCGHHSLTVNNTHATALDCGACAGASGASNARAVAALLNEADVRTGLSERGIVIPDRTWFVGAVHDTASDHVTILDRHLAPDTHVHAIDELQRRLDRAGALQSAERARHLPPPPSGTDVRSRGRDWAQVRPEWGLATNAAFVIAPRSATVGLDLDGRAFLHSYDAATDPDGRILEAIMTAPLVVGHWISSQYYFSTVDPEIFGAGDKLLHNPIGTVGVVAGAGGDLRPGLPLQSTHVAGSSHHQPLRLLAVVQADQATVDAIIARNGVLSRLVRGSWLRIAARSEPGRPWAIRSAGGSWSEQPAVADPIPARAH